MTAILRKVEKTFTFEDQRVEVNELAWDVYNLQLGNAKLSDFSVVVNANSGTGDLTYDNTTGEFEYTPPDLSQFLTSYTETDPVFVASVAYNITSGDVTNWNNAHSWGDHSLEGYIKGIGSFSIGALSDVDTTTNAPSAKDHLVFDGTNWVPTSPEANVFISDAPPANPDVGDLWYESDKGALKIYYEDADSTQWVDTNVLPISSGAGITLTDLSVITDNPLGGGGLSYDNTNGQFTFTPANVLTLSDFSVTSASPSGNGSLTYLTGTFTFTPPDLSDYLTAIDLSVNTASPNGNGSLTYDNATTTFTYTPPDLSSFITTQYSLPIATTTQLGGVKIDGNSITIDNNGVISASTGTTINALNDIQNVNVPNPTDGHVLKWDLQSQKWIAAADLTATGGTGISLTDLSVNVAAAGTPNLTYNDQTGVFTYTPPLNTGGGSTNVSIGTTAPIGATAGDLWWNSTQGQLKIYYNDGNSSQWVDACGPNGTSPSGGNTSVTVSDTAPTNPSSGDLWWHSIQGQLKIYYDDGNSQQWVDTSGPNGTGGGSATSVTVSDTAPTSPSSGDLWYKSDEGQLKIYYNDGNSSQWVDTGGNSGTGGGGTPGGATVTTNDTAPTSPNDGDLWWKSDEGQLKVYYDDGNSQQWVDTAGGSGVNGINVKDDQGVPGGPWLDLGVATGLNFQGNGVQVNGTGNEKTVIIPGGIQVQNDGTQLSTTCFQLNFTGAGVTASGTDATKTINIPGGGSGIALTDLSVGANGAATATGGLSYDNTNGVFTYTPQTTFSGNYNDLTNQPTIPSAYGDSDVDTHLNKSSAGTNEVLSWNGTDYDWVAQSGGGGSASSDPIGTIVMWSGASNAIPTGYQLCDGSASATTELQAIRANVPDLRDKFIVGAGSSYNVNDTGGSADTTLPAHSHVISAYNNSDVNGTGISGKGDQQSIGSITTNDAGSGNGTGTNLPPYYAVCYIIKHSASLSGTQVKSDWNATSGVAEILNKPTIPAAQIQSDWNQTSTSALDYIKNKPTISSGGNGIVTANVKDFGALGDDATDDTAAIQAAINSLANGSVGDGGVVYLPPGVYRIAAPLTFMSNAYSITLKGSTTHFPVGTFGGSIIRNTGAGDAIEIINSMSITITNLGIDHTSSSAGTAISATSTASKQGITVDQVYILNHSKGIDFIGYANSIIRNTEIRDQPNNINSTHAILLKKGGDARQDQIRLENVIVEGETPAGSGNPHNHSVGLKVEDWTNSIWVKDCAFLRMTNGIEYDQSVGGRVATAGAFHRIENTDVDHCRNNGMFFDGGYAIWVQNCYIGSNGYPSGSVSASGLVTGENFKGTMWINNADCRGNSLYGLAFNVNHTKIHINSCHVGDNGTAQPSSSAGIYALDGANDITIMGGQCGGDNYGHHTNSSNQQNGIKFNGDNHQRIVIHGVDVTCNISTGISWVNTSGNNVNSGTNFIESCPGYSPGQSPFP